MKPWGATPKPAWSIVAISRSWLALGSPSKVDDEREQERRRAYHDARDGQQPINVEIADQPICG